MCVQNQYAFDPHSTTDWRLFVMLHGFFDDSGKEGDPSNRIVCAAGYIAPPSVLNSFQEIWKLFLVKHNLEWLHMKDFMNEKSSEYAYLGWDWAKKKSVLEDFS